MKGVTEEAEGHTPADWSNYRDRMIVARLLDNAQEA